MEKTACSPKGTNSFKSALLSKTAGWFHKLAILKCAPLFLLPLPGRAKAFEEDFLISPCYSLKLCIEMLISFLFSFAFHFSFFIAI